VPRSDARLAIFAIDRKAALADQQSLSLARNEGTGGLQEKIRSVTGSRGIRVRSSNGQIVLSGVAGNAVAAERAIAVTSGQDRRR
jgi:Flp pilus assembly secretin CpaC